MGDVDPLSGHIEQLQQALTAARGSASNSDGSVIIEVETNGAIHAIDLDARGEQLTAVELAPLLMDLHRQAVANAAEAVRKAVERLSGDIQVRNEQRRVADAFTRPRPEDSEPPTVGGAPATRSARNSPVPQGWPHDRRTPASTMPSDDDERPGNNGGTPDLTAPHRNGERGSLVGGAVSSPADRLSPPPSTSSAAHTSPHPVSPVTDPEITRAETAVDQELYGTHGNPESDTAALVDEYYDRITLRDPLLDLPPTYNDWWDLPGP